MSHRIRSTARPTIAMSGFALLVLLAFAAPSHAQCPSPNHALLGRTPIAAVRQRVSVDQSLTSSGDRVTSAYFAQFAGVGAEGRDMIWQGAAAGAVVGEMTVRLARVGRDIDAASPTWPVEGIVIVSGDDPQRAFAAEVHGTIDWATNYVQLNGEISVGDLRGMHIEQSAELIDYDLSGELLLSSAALAAVP
jgi:hypothetical protein